ncbi:LOW QUALITY PROTEIN: PH-interacting protein-like [Lolium rigidum]|uniref:LOW QUALITY PROTEIN: PH-interacting protein-like n=1 Tax=Lolium rigidum TaxID=89674 RepID=UPI001F5C58D4|nr:LOW QUALITY PROTEIN: PH-interacting protein-like [Lolium rigidum]
MDSVNHQPSANATSVSMIPLDFPSQALEKINSVNKVIPSDVPSEAPVDIDMREIYFLIMHFLSHGPFKRTVGELCNELLEHQLLPRRYHAWYSRGGIHSGEENDDGVSLPVGYRKLLERYPHIGKDHLVKLLKQLMVSSCRPDNLIGGRSPNAADVPTLLGSNSFSLLAPDRGGQDKETPRLPRYLRWPHIQADQVHGLGLREIGGFTKNHRAPSVRASCYAIAKPSTLVEKMQIIKKLRGHQNAAYCATFDRTGHYVITGSDDRLVKIWAMETAFCLASCRGHEGDITDLAVSSNNAVVASASNDFIIRVWRIPDGMPMSVLKGHTGVVTTIAFSPRAGAAFQLLSSSDDGTCRMWDARYSQQPPRIYIPKPPDVAPGKSIDASSSAVQVQPTNHQILCCAFNANGTVFVTGSSDTFARVWSACKSGSEEHDQPNHEMDVLSGHENDVNYVQFSGCVVSRSFSIDSSHTTKEENNLKLRYSGFRHSIVTCSRDGSAIIWAPRSRRSHGKTGRWTRAYHLKVPPPPMAPQTIRGGPRQRQQPTPRGVNMIVWSLDNRFVLAAIMDCRICVWNASDGSLVHSLIGHKESTFVLDVHPFNPRIAMSAGYDGKTIIWDIWEGKPVQIYETGHFKLVDGKFSPDGTSLVLTDEIGQIFIIGTGQGESQKDAKDEQFFLGDYRPLIQDTNGNAIDQETQLPPYKRNIQDLLCDSGMIPYPEPFQSMYQKRRLGTLGIEWRPPSVNFAVGPTYNATTGEYQIIPIIDPDRWEPLPEIPDFFEFEPENEVISDDTDSEYDGLDDNSSEGEPGVLSGDSSGASYSSAEIDADNLNGTANRRRSRRKKKKSDADLVTSSGRRVKKINLDGHDVATTSRPHRGRKSKIGRSSKRKRSSKSRGPRPQRRAARNALSFLTKIGASSEEDEDDSGSLSDSEFNTESTEAEQSARYGQPRYGRESNHYDSEDVTQPSHFTETQGNSGNNRKLILRIPRRDLKTQFPSKNGNTESSTEDKAVVSLAAAKREAIEPELAFELGSSSACKAELSTDGYQTTISGLHNGSAVHSNDKIKWGEVKRRSSKRSKLVDSSGNMRPSLDNALSQGLDESGSEKTPHEYGNGIQQMVEQNVQISQHAHLDSIHENHNTDDNSEVNLPGEERLTNNNSTHVVEENNKGCSEQFYGTEPISFKLKLSRSRGFVDGASSSDKSKTTAVGSDVNSEHDEVSMQHDEVSATNQHRSSDFTSVSRSFQERTDNGTCLHDSKKLHFESAKTCTAVYTRSKSSKYKKNPDPDAYGNGGSTSISNDGGYQPPPDYSPATPTGSLRRSARRSCAYTDDARGKDAISHEKKSSHEASTSGRQTAPNARETWGSTSRSERYKKESGNFPDTHLFEKKQQVSKYPWLMLLEHEDIYRYIPQLDDEVMYLRQGHEEYLNETLSSLRKCPWNWIEGLKAVELCKIKVLDYKSHIGSGDSCCKLTVEFIDHASSGFGEDFEITLPELVNFPDFLVERTRFEAAITQNWVVRDKCKVWWTNGSEEGGGSWWEGRVMAITPKSPDFPDSPWERYVIKYKNDGSHHPHSPWELHPATSSLAPWKHPHIDPIVRNKLLSAVTNLQKMSRTNQDRYGVLRLDTVAGKPDFINRFPVQFSIELIRARLHNNYYRTLEAVKHDARVMLANADSYFSKSTEIRRLSDWIQDNLLSL